MIAFLRHIQLIFSSSIKTYKFDKCFMGGSDFSRQFGLRARWRLKGTRHLLFDARA